VPCRMLAGLQQAACKPVARGHGEHAHGMPYPTSSQGWASCIPPGSGSARRGWAEDFGRAALSASPPCTWSSPAQIVSLPHASAKTAAREGAAESASCAHSKGRTREASRQAQRRNSRVLHSLHRARCSRSSPRQPLRPPAPADTPSTAGRQRRRPPPPLPPRRPAASADAPYHMLMLPFFFVLPPKTKRGTRTTVRGSPTPELAPHTP